MTTTYSVHRCRSAGFVATIAVVLLATATLAFSLSTLAAAALYADGVYAHELRIQAQDNADSCLDTVGLMAERDYFLSGRVEVKDFGCIAIITNDAAGHIHADATAYLERVSYREMRDFRI